MGAGEGPRHVAIIMDGNGRWARGRGLPRAEGHRAGAEALRRTVEACEELGISVLTVYAFSTENWKRSPAEVNALMGLIVEYVRKERAALIRNNIRVRVIGDTTGLPLLARREIEDIVAATERSTGATLCLALNYGGRREIVEAARELATRAARGTLSPDDIDDRSFEAELATRGLPDPDLLIRPSGEMRISNFLLWQAAYAELWFTPVLWPDFDLGHLRQAVAAYRSRNRRYGGRPEEGN